MPCRIRLSKTALWINYREHTVHERQNPLSALIGSALQQLKSILPVYSSFPVASYLGPQDVFIDIACEDGGGWQQSRVCWWHHCSSYSSDADDGDVGWGEVLQSYGQNMTCLSTLIRWWQAICGRVPVWNQKCKNVTQVSTVPLLFLINFSAVLHLLMPQLLQSTQRGFPV